MFDYIRGVLIHKYPTCLVLESTGIGYLINIPLSTYDNLPDRGEVKVFTQLFVRDEQVMLFGFASADERDAFRLLISVNGIGPKIALSILSGSTVADLKRAVINGDTKALETIKGIGKKTAARIVLELKESIKVIAPMSAFSEMAGQDTVISDAIMALVALGYVRPNAQKAVDNALKGFNLSDGVEALIRRALRGA